MTHSSDSSVQTLVCNTRLHTTQLMINFCVCVQLLPRSTCWILSQRRKEPSSIALEPDQQLNWSFRTFSMNLSTSETLCLLTLKAKIISHNVLFCFSGPSGSRLFGFTSICNNNCNTATRPCLRNCVPIQQSTWKLANLTCRELRT